MDKLEDKVAVITGGASGFGREIARLCAAERMRVVVADVDEAGLAATEELLGGAPTLRVRCDVSRAADVERLAEETYRRFGAAHLLCNNAGVALGGPIWTSTLEDWQWVLGVNLMGVVHGVRSFVPRMLAQADDCHIVNTASVAGLISVPGMSVYCVSKHGVVALSECLHHELRAEKARIGVSVLCPAYVNTAITESARNRPAELAAANPLAQATEDRVRAATRAGRLSAADVARAVIDGVKQARFYVLTHPRIKGAVEARMGDMLEDRVPVNPMP